MRTKRTIETEEGRSMRKTGRSRLVMGSVAAVLAAAVVAGTQRAEAAFPGGRGKIAFDRSFRIWLKNPSLASPETKLREDGASDGQAAFSPEGSRVAFIRQAEIYVTNADGTGTPRRVTNNSVADFTPVWSHEGTRIAFARGGQIWSMNADGTNQKPLTSDAANPSFTPAWSVPLPGAPDGKIAYVYKGHIWTMLPNGSGKAPLSYTCPTENGGVCDNAVGNPTFSPDGARIAAEYFGDIFMVSSSGGTSTLLLPPELNGEGNPAWSPDGMRIAFQQSFGTPSHIYMANADGSSTQPVKLTSSDVGEANPDWQPIPICTQTVNANNDPFVGTSGKDVLCGDSRNNTIDGGGGPDIILAKGGNDTVTGSGGNDTLDGGPGIDTVSYFGTSAVKANLTTGFATGPGADVLLGIENVTGSSGNDQLTGSDGNNTLIGGGGVDKLFGLNGNDTLNSMDGVSGNDTVDGGPGTDSCITDATEASVTGCP
jgi:Tol biopolymer transport system component